MSKVPSEILVIVLALLFEVFSLGLGLLDVNVVQLVYRINNELLNVGCVGSLVSKNILCNLVEIMIDCRLHSTGIRGRDFLESVHEV